MNAVPKKIQNYGFLLPWDLIHWEVILLALPRSTSYLANKYVYTYIYIDSFPNNTLLIYTP